jgi:hypothetical protein
MRYDWDLMIPYLIEKLEDDRIANKLNQDLPKLTGSDGPWLIPGESRAEHDAKVRDWRKWWENEAARLGPARSVSGTSACGWTTGRRIR